MEDIWDLLKEFDFLLTNKINIDFACILCKKILIDARIGTCGCRFCKICIENYLKNGENICPGSTDECKEEYLNLIENINIDHSINRKIGKLNLYCPIESCTFSDQIINMNQHLIGCRENAIKCSFSVNGCNFISLSGENVDKHCKMSKDKHLELVLLKIKNMENIIDSINKNKNDFQQEIEKLKKEIEKDKDLLKQNEENTDQINKSKIILQQEIESLKSVNKTLKIENDNYKIILKQNQTTINQCKTDNNQLKVQNDIQTKQIADYKAKYNDEITYKNNLIKYLSEILLGKKTEFVWKINCFSQLKKSINKMNSDKYFIFKEDLWVEFSMDFQPVENDIDYDEYECIDNSYYRLRVYISHHNNGRNSSCPFTFEIIIGVVNRVSGNFVVSFNEKATFDGSGIFLENRIPQDEIQSEITNDCLTVKCLVKLSIL